MARNVGAREIVQAWGRILAGYGPNISIEITKECPLRCPGCYAYGDDHLGGDVTLRGLHDYKGDELVERFMALVDRHRPLHVSIVGGEPLVRYRELGQILPQLAARQIHAQVVTSAVRPIPIEWASLRRLRLLVPKLQMLDGMLNVYANPPASPDQCVFAQTTECYSSDLERRITPCQFGGNPDCLNCGCIASAGLEAISRHKLKGGLP